jgi:hypothetical protein
MVSKKINIAYSREGKIVMKIVRWDLNEFQSFLAYFPYFEK